MKYTLKVLKAALDTANEYGNVTKWIKGFEAELRERILKCGWTECTIIKEILGE